MQALLSYSADPDPRVQMTGEIIGLLPILLSDVLNIMYKRKISDSQHLLTHRYPRLFIPACSKNIMIPQHQPEPKVREIIPPPQEQIKLFVLPAMEQVPHNQQLPRLKILNERQQPQKILPVYRLRNRNPRFPEVPRFPEMKVGKDQRLLLFPIQATVR